jgi:large subunit ribosomal protein L30
MAGTITIKLISPGTGRQERQKRMLSSLGLTKINKTVTLPDNPGFRGMVAAAPHLLVIVNPKDAK